MNQKSCSLGMAAARLALERGDYQEALRMASCAFEWGPTVDERLKIAGIGLEAAVRGQELADKGEDKKKYEAEAARWQQIL